MRTTLHSNKISAQWRTVGVYVRLLNAGHAFLRISMCSRRIMCRIMRNPVYCIYENKYADKLRRVRAADRCLCFLCLDSTNYLEFILNISTKFQASSYPLIWHGLFRTWSETPKADLHICGPYENFLVWFDA